MKHFISKRAQGREPSEEFINPRILPELEALHAALMPLLKVGHPFLYLGATARGEGTSTIAWSLAYYLALRTGEDCLYVDGNTEHPSIQLVNGLPETGLSDYLQGGADFRMLPFPTELPRVAAVHRGRARGSFVHLAEDQAARFADDARRYYRAVVFDSRPGFDKYVEIWSRYSDAVLLVAGYRHTKREVFSRVLKGFDQAQIPIKGVLLNKKEHPIPEFLYRRL